jgi:hypothetical protein
MRSAPGRDQARAVVKWITGALADQAAKAAADAQKALVDARRALRRAVNNLSQRAPNRTGHGVLKHNPGQNAAPGRRTRESKINNSAPDPQVADRGHTQPTPTFSGASS